MKKIIKTGIIAAAVVIALVSAVRFKKELTTPINDEYNKIVQISYILTWKDC